MKICFKCELPLPFDDFYKHPAMKDGYLGKCKECAKKDVSANYANRRQQYANYDHERQQTLERRIKKRVYFKRHNERNPLKRAARTAVGNALRSGLLKRGPCEAVGCLKVAQAHHDDYSKPLSVRWLCDEHHKKLHRGVLF